MQSGQAPEPTTQRLTLTEHLLRGFYLFWVHSVPTGRPDLRYFPGKTLSVSQGGKHRKSIGLASTRLVSTPQSA